MSKVTTKQAVIRAFEQDIVKLRMLKKKKENGNEESDAEVLNRVIREVDSKLKKVTNLNIKFDGSFLQ